MGKKTFKLIKIMYNFTKKFKKHIYNQNISNDFANDCTVFTQMMILALTYDIWLKYSTWNRLVDYFLNIWKLHIWWAIFEIIYWASAYLFTKRSWTQVIVDKENIFNDSFDKKLKQWFAFWLWLINWNSIYLKAVNDWVLTKKNIDSILEKWWWFWHNNCYAYIDWNYRIYEIYKWTRVKCELETLKYWAKKGLFYSPVRTFKITDKSLEKALFFYKTWKNKEIPKNEENIYNKASQLRVFRSEYKKTP